MHTRRTLTVALSTVLALSVAGIVGATGAQAAPVAQTQVSAQVATKQVAKKPKPKSRAVRGARGGSFAAQVQATAASVAAPYWVDVAWVDTTSCGERGGVSRTFVTVRGCSTPGTGTIELSLGGGNPANTRVSRGRVLAMVTAVTQHEVAHRLIERTTGSLFPVERNENVADAYAVTYLGMNPALVSYGYTDGDVATAVAIHG
ncbi:hypothetical protein Cch01nite_09540 [Cellulomonas chitinilytica]|uniref:Uncharacterized protein n=1 Tax=Cellulomonas chitinilytica TaxID=398759 RepID=A0A919P054_9CELL|nr:hypothetical protein [Cellulomonas chitinilytica]GIG20230.1 hypothetical protein Cch01nite_09540 [Cellulomonas chitinilytica]